MDKIMSYQRSRQREYRLKKLFNETNDCSAAGAYYDIDKNRYVRYYGSKNGRAKYLRKISNKKVRKFQGSLKYGDYRRLYDYWYELY